MAAEDGVTLTHWGAELLVRSGVQLGSNGSRPLTPDDPAALCPFSIRNEAGKRIAVVTAIFGDFDRLLPVDPAWAKNTDFFLFSDQVFDQQRVWQPVHCNYDHHDSRRRARFVKVNLPTYFSDYEWVIWIDGNILLCTDPATIARALDAQQVDFASFRHPDRTTIIAEAEACLRFDKDDIGAIGNHIKRNIPTIRKLEPLLFETNVCAMRPGDQEVQNMCSVWWEKIMNGSKRDQLSLPIAVYDIPRLRYGFLPDRIIKSAWFAKVRHKNEQR
ncbi:glycosyltransferase domain-containing protein [Yoonia vestfoldensis]|uniref:glycosyltransferase domain-containing protein n=1 Tax=Yoonia vestfoldensis TaxID=245188 RepID=UPI00035E2C54|nr:glycosyltransferase domain-containing protein [Yoonia vestfoldensis]